jgi:hypothetical protein
MEDEISRLYCQRSALRLGDLAWRSSDGSAGLKARVERVVAEFGESWPTDLALTLWDGTKARVVAAQFSPLSTFERWNLRWVADGGRKLGTLALGHEANSAERTPACAAQDSGRAGGRIDSACLRAAKATPAARTMGLTKP